MWSSKMAACWRGEDGDLNTGNSGFLPGNTPEQFVPSRRSVDGVEMDTQSCVDHSILAIFEDSAVTSEDKSGAEEESANLLSALTEMLDSVEDDDGTLSPFDTLPDTQLLTHPENRDDPMEQFLANRLRPRSKGSNIKFTIGEDEMKKERNTRPQLLKQQSQTTIYSNSKKADAEVRVFTSTSLVNLVRIMHPYCLRLHVEEEVGDKVGRDQTLFSQEEVWKYERPSEESDEEINVVSDDEATVKETKREGDDGKRLKGVLLNGKSSKASTSGGKKRVSFGAVQVASFDESVVKGLEKKHLTRGGVSVTLNTMKASKDLTDSALKAQTTSSESNVPSPKGETKAKSLSLQQYRQLRQRRKPLVEKQGNYTTKWPSVSETPKELTPILCLQGQRQISCAPKTLPHVDGRRAAADQLHRSQTPAHNTHSTSAPPRPHPAEAKPSPHLPRSVLKRPRVHPKVISPVSPLPAVIESKSSPVKKAALLSSDPPNPVLLPLPVSQTPAATHSSPEIRVDDSPQPDSTRHFQDLQSESSGQSYQLPLQPKPELLLGDQRCTTTIQDSENQPTETPSSVSSTQTKSSSECEQPQQCSENLNVPEPKTLLSSHTSAPIDAPTQVKKGPASQEPSSPDSVIEAADVTSLLEQFEETQAKEETVEPKLVAASSISHLPTDGVSPSVGTSPCKPPGTSDSPETLKTLRNTHHLQTSEGDFIPEPFSTEIVLSSQPDLPARRKNPPSKVIQIIDPRPLPSKKTHSHFPEFPAAHTYAAVCLDHDYCSSVDRSATSSPQRIRASKLREISKDTDESQVVTASSAAECKQQTSTCGPNVTIRTVESQHLPEGPRTVSEANLSMHDPVLPLSDSTPREKEARTAPCTPPTPPPSPPDRGRDRKRYRGRSPLTDSSSSSCSSSSSSSRSRSRSPKRQKRRHRRSESSSCSSSCSSSASRSPPRRYRLSYSRSRCSRSRSRSWSRSRSRSRSRSPSPGICSRRWRHVYSSRESRKIRREREIRIQKLKAIDERRVVYVGRICRSMTHDELRQRFSQFGEVECVSLHFRDRGDHYGFVTFYNMKDAFTAIDNSGKLRRPDELPFDICFGGRRQFCNSDYADLDADRETEPSPANNRFKDVDFDSLLKQAQRGLKR